ncbi:hypothetical protein [Zunongwangia sp. HGR-M22]|uniref:hypothetical protein n=1 Tax=Zunongwangia sp. HGR-M22 TaxID=3015168 RepID=UPI0022DCF4E9|nr:hypothetical protein [Zunongwangia sp. HGR-M22]WBL25650.1 hypothetical protein PBT91_17365 [Zunongwangia sp. HGR-M22]
MKNLKTEQIDDIRKILFYKGVVFCEIQEELIDHIASEIEEKMASENLSFKGASDSVFSKWENAFILKQNRWLLGKEMYPSIIYEELKRAYLKMILPLSIISFILAGLLWILFQTQNELFSNLSYLICSFLIVSGLFVSFVYKKLKNGNQTIYSHFLLREFKMFVPMSILLIIEIFEKDLQNPSIVHNILFFVFMAMMLCFSIYLISLYTKHVDVQRKFS